MYVFESFIFCDAYVTYLAGCLPCLHHFYSRICVNFSNDWMSFNSSQLRLLGWWLWRKLKVQQGANCNIVTLSMRLIGTRNFYL